MRAFCSVFEDCTLWTAAGLEWMLAGTNGARAPSAEDFAKQWKDPVLGPQLRADGLEAPEQLGACFLADAEQLRSFVGDAPPLVDDFPQRMSADVERVLVPSYVELMRVDGARQRFADSRAVSRLWPAETRARTAAWFSTQEMVDGLTMQNYGGPRIPRWRFLHDSLAMPQLVTLPLWLQGFTPLQVDDPGPSAEDAAGGAEGALAAARAMARRDYADAERRLTSLLEERHPESHHLARTRVLAAVARGDADGARAYAVEAIEREGAFSDPDYWEWLEDLLNRPVPRAPAAPRAIQPSTRS